MYIVEKDENMAIRHAVARQSLRNQKNERKKNEKRV
jgi:hypothetical protein